MSAEILIVDDNSDIRFILDELIRVTAEVTVETAIVPIARCPR